MGPVLTPEVSVRLAFSVLSWGEDRTTVIEGDFLISNRNVEILELASRSPGWASQFEALAPGWDRFRKIAQWILTQSVVPRLCTSADCSFPAPDEICMELGSKHLESFTATRPCQDIQDWKYKSIRL